MKVIFDDSLNKIGEGLKKFLLAHGMTLLKATPWIALAWFIASIIPGTLARMQTVQATQTQQAVAIQNTLSAPTQTATIMPTPTATPEPIWAPANRYVPTSPEIHVSEVGLNCRGTKFTIQGDSLIVEFNDVTESISAADPLFASGTKWAVLLPLQRWGVTYLDTTNGTGQSSQITQPGWIVDNHGCIIDP